MTQEDPPPTEETRETLPFSVVGEDRIQVEFKIDDLVRQLMRQSVGRPLESCNGCNGCSN